MARRLGYSSNAETRHPLPPRRFPRRRRWPPRLSPLLHGRPGKSPGRFEPGPAPSAKVQLPLTGEVKPQAPAGRPSPDRTHDTRGGGTGRPVSSRTDVRQPTEHSPPAPPLPETVTASDLHFALRVLIRSERHNLPAAHPAVLQRPDLWHPAFLEDLAARLNSRTWQPPAALAAARLKGPFATRPLILPRGPEELIVYAHLAARLRDAISPERRSWYGRTACRLSLHANTGRWPIGSSRRAGRSSPSTLTGPRRSPRFSRPATASRRASPRAS